MKEETIVLIVEDEKELSDRIKLILEMEGYRAEEAFSGKEAREMGMRYPYDIALLDINLPDMQGTKLIPDLLKSNPDMAIIIVTGFPDQENTMVALNLGAKGYLTKPFEPEKLIEMLDDRVRKQSEAIDMTQEKMGEFIQRRLEKMRKQK